MRSRVAALSLDRSPNRLPFEHGLLRVSAASRAPNSHREAFDVIVDGRGEVSVALLSIQAGAATASVHDAFAVARKALVRRAPMYEVVTALRTWCAQPENEATLATTIVRFAQPDSRLEVLNAGSPAVACVQPGGRVALNPPLSSAIDGRRGGVHPYELLPLVWGSSWFLMSAALTAGALDGDAVHTRLIQHSLAEHATELATADGPELNRWLTRIAGDVAASTKPGPAEGSLVVVQADPSLRFSGIR